MKADLQAQSYSRLVLKDFNGILLRETESTLIDLHFFGAAHHFWCLREPGIGEYYEFHETLYLAHVRHLIELIYQFGDFSQAVDPSGSFLEFRAAWHPDRPEVDYAEMFEKMCRHRGFSVGAKFPADVYLRNLKSVGLGSPPVAA